MEPSPCSMSALGEPVSSQDTGVLSLSVCVCVCVSVLYSIPAVRRVAEPVTGGIRTDVPPRSVHASVGVEEEGKRDVGGGGGGRESTTGAGIPREGGPRAQTCYHEPFDTIPDPDTNRGAAMTAPAAADRHCLKLGLRTSTRHHTTAPSPRPHGCLFTSHHHSPGPDRKSVV